MARENLRKTGSQMEEIAASYLAEHGVRVLERNYRSRNAEIDIIGEQDGTLLFIEVKARKEGEKSGTAAEAVGAVKQMKICRCAEYYLYRKGIDPYRARIRFDVVALTMKEKEDESGPEIRWFPNAFAYAPLRPGKPHWRVW